MQARRNLGFGHVDATFHNVWIAPDAQDEGERGRGSDVSQVRISSDGQSALE